MSELPANGGRMRCASAILGNCLSAVIVAAIIVTAGLSFRSGIDRGEAGQLADNSFGQFLEGVCAVLSHEKYRSGHYVCDGAAEQQMRDAGLAYDEATLARLGMTLPQWLADSDFLNSALDQVFASPPRASAGVAPIGWGVDAGYADFVDLAFRLFGHKVQALYYAYFLLLLASTTLFCVQFWRNYFALFAILSFHYTLLFFVHRLDEFQIYTLTNARVPATLALIPLLHALFLIIYRLRPTRMTLALFAPQALLIAAAADFRVLALGAAIALGIWCVIFCIVGLWRNSWKPGALQRCWPGMVVLLCLAGGFVLETSIEDRRLAAIGGMRVHSFWEPLYYDLQQLRPDWDQKYAAQHQGVSGDGTALVGANLYRERHGLLHNEGDYRDGDETQGLTQAAYEKYIRAAYIEFVLNDPWYVARLKYQDALILEDMVEAYTLQIWDSLDWRFVALAVAVWIALALQVFRKAESLGALSLGAGVLALTAVLVACPVWAMVINMDLLSDLVIFGVSVTFVLALWAAVSIAVVVGSGVLHFVGAATRVAPDAPRASQQKP